MVEKNILIATVIIVLIASVAGYALGQFSDPTESPVTTTSSTTITEIQTTTITSTLKITETETSTTAVGRDLPIPSPANSTAVIRMFYLFDGRVLATLSIDKPSYFRGETVHIKGTFTNISPDNITLWLNYYEIRIRNRSDNSVWVYPEYLFVPALGPGPPYIQFTLSPGETKTGGNWSTVDWNMVGLHLTLNAEGRLVYPYVLHDNDYVPSGQYTLMWRINLQSINDNKGDNFEEEIPFTITKQD